MLKHFARLFILFCFCLPVHGQQEDKEVILTQSAKVKSSEIFLIAEQESVLAKDGGYLANPKVIDLFAEMSYQYTGGRFVDETIKFRFRSPENIVPGKKYPLVIWLHGQGESGDDNKRQLSHMQSTMEFLAGPNKLDFYILATQCPKDNRAWENSISNRGKGDAPLVILIEILEHLLRNCPINQNRISVVGVCSGGDGVWPLLHMKPDFFSSVAVFSTSPPPDLVWDEHHRRTSLWAFNNQGDKSAPVEPMGEFVKQVNDAGGLASLTVGSSGHDSWSKAMREDKIVAWLVQQDRERSSPPPGVVVYPRNSMIIPFLLFLLPILLSIPFVVLKVARLRCSSQY